MLSSGKLHVTAQLWRLLSNVLGTTVVVTCGCGHSQGNPQGPRPFLGALKFSSSKMKITPTLLSSHRLLEKNTHTHTHNNNRQDDTVERILGTVIMERFTHIYNHPASSWQNWGRTIGTGLCRLSLTEQWARRNSDSPFQQEGLSLKVTLWEKPPRESLADRVALLSLGILWYLAPQPPSFVGRPFP